MKCEKCGRGVGLVRRGMRFSDGKSVCFDCARILGFKPEKDWKMSIYLYSYEEIKDGLDVYNQRRWDAESRRESSEMGLMYEHYKELNSATATDLEKKLFSAMCAIWDDEGCDISQLTIAPGDHGSLLVLKDDVVILQFKGEKQVRWILFPDSPEKVRIGNSARINSLANRLIAAYHSGE